MLQTIKELFGRRLEGLDGDIGHVKDVYFDDESWAIRYLVADTGTWLTDRLVLLSPHAFEKKDLRLEVLQVRLRKQQMEDSPPIDTEKPVSRQFEEEYHHFYAWPAYWEGATMAGMGAYSAILPPSEGSLPRPAHHSHEDAHLQSARAIIGYHVQETNASIGRIVDFHIDERNWAIHDLVVETGHWYSGREILISPRKVLRIDCPGANVFVNLTRADVVRSGETKPFKEGATVQVGGNLYD